MKQIIIAFVAISLIFAACKKDTKVVTTTTSNIRKKYLTNAPWKIVKIEEQTTLTSPLTDITYQWSACELDDIQTFAFDNTYNYRPGASVCDTFDKQTDNGNWNFVNTEETIIKVTSPTTGYYSVDIELLDDNTMIWNGIATDHSTLQRYTFGH